MIGVAKSQAKITDKTAIVASLIENGADVNYISELNVESHLPFQGADTALDVCGKDSPLGKHLVEHHSAKTSAELRKTLSWSEQIWQERYSNARERDEKNQRTRGNLHISPSSSSAFASNYVSDLPSDRKPARKDLKVATKHTTDIISSIADKCTNILDFPVDVTAEILRKAGALEEVEQLKDNPGCLVDFCEDMKRFRPIVKAVIEARIRKLPNMVDNHRFFRPVSKLPESKKAPSQSTQILQAEASQGEAETPYRYSRSSRTPRPGTPRG